MNNKSNMTAAEMLYAARTNSRKSRELPVIAKKLCIREDFLEALETGNYALLQENVYILGFARNYATELGLDPVEISKKLKEELGITPIATDPELAEGAENANAATGADAGIDADSSLTPLYTPSGESSAAQNVSNSQFEHGRTGRRIMLFAAIISAILAVAGGAYIIADLDSESNGEEISPLAANENKIAFALPVKFEYGTENKDTSTIAMQASSETWLKVDRGEVILFSRVLMPGDVYYAPTNKPGARATVGNAGGLDIYINGKPAPKLGAMHTRATNVPLTEEGVSQRARKPVVANPDE
ncbi:MAG: helix-turn-helix domain-containing protein [Rickettsiales bacterium]|jgi:cytoskeleton protein RodZ|nr:helix-turn-helix domain-containing protein [Rickettsiales bacterium]